MAIEKWDELLDRKPLIKKLVDSNRWDELPPLIELQKWYDTVEKYKSSEKISFGLAKGYLNIFDVSENEWTAYLKDYFLTKYPDVKVLDYKKFFTETNTYNGYTYKDPTNKLGKLDLNDGIYLMNMDTYRSQMYGHMLRKIKKEYNMPINLYTCVAPYRSGKSLLKMKALKVYQHLRHFKMTEDVFKKAEDFLIN